MGNCQAWCFHLFPSRSSDSPAINTHFEMPSSIPSWPSGGGFAAGSIDLGGLELRQLSTFTKVWATGHGGPADAGATFFFPSSVPTGFFPLGSYAQPNSKPFFGRALVARDAAAAGVLAAPSDYTLLWSSDGAGDSACYFWLPIAPEGYNPVGYLVTSSPEKPSPDLIRCVREDFTDQCEEDKAEIWASRADNKDLTVHGLVPASRGTRAAGLSAGTFIVRTAAGGSGGGSPSMRCLKNKNSSLSAAMPNLSQINAVVEAYSPWIYFHPDESFLPSTVSWFFSNGALLFSKDNPKNPTAVGSTGDNLPQGGDNDGAYWLDLPAGDDKKERVMKGDLSSSATYVHVKPMLGGTATDVVFWIFYPFNGPAKASVGLINFALGKIGEHVGDWEHLTLRISNFDGELWRVYFSHHSSGEWVDAPELEFEAAAGKNKPVAYASLNGHAFYPKQGLVLQGSSELGIGIRNDTAKGKKKMDSGERFEVVSAEHLQAPEPAWLQYMREWGPKVTYDIGKELEKVERILPGKVKKALRKLVDGLPVELLGEEGPTGPKVKASWNEDER